MSRNTQHTKRTLLILSFIFIVICAAALPAFAEEGHGHEGHGSVWDLRWHWFHFVIYLGVLYALLRNSIPEALTKRRDRIVRAVDAGKNQLEQAQKMLDDAKKRLVNVKADIARVSAEIENDAQREAAAILEDAKRRAAITVSRAKESAQTERKAAQLELQKELAEEVLKRAEAILRRDLDQNSDKPLRDAAISGIKGLVH